MVFYGVQWGGDDPGLGDMGSVRGAADHFEGQAEFFEGLVSRVCGVREKVGLSWSGVGAEGAKGRLAHIAESVGPVAVAIRGRVGALRWYADRVDELKVEVVRVLAEIDFFEAELVSLVGEARLATDAYVEAKGGGGDVGEVDRLRLVSLKVGDRVAGVEGGLVKCRGELARLAEVRRGLDSQVAGVLLAEGTKTVASLSYVPFAARLEGFGVPGSAGEAARLAARVVDGGGSDEDLRMMRLWLGEYGADSELMAVFYGSLAKFGVGPSDVTDLLVGDDPRFAGVRDGWGASLCSTMNDPQVAGAFTKFMGQEGIEGFYASLGDAGPGFMKEGGKVPVISPGQNTGDRDTYLNVLGNAIAGACATTSRTGPKGHWLVGEVAGKNLASSEALSGLFYYTHRGGHVFDHEFLVACGKELKKVDDVSGRYPRDGATHKLGLGVWDYKLEHFSSNSAPWGEDRRGTAFSDPPDAVYWWGMATSRSVQGSQMVLTDEEMRRWLMWGAGGAFSREGSASAIIVTGTVTGTGHRDPEVVKRSVRAAQLVLLDAGQPEGKEIVASSTSGPDGRYSTRYRDAVELREGRINEGTKVAIAATIATHMPSVARGYQISGDSRDNNNKVREVFAWSQKNSKYGVGDKAGYPEFGFAIEAAAITDAVESVCSIEAARDIIGAGVTTYTGAVYNHVVEGPGNPHESLAAVAPLIAKFSSKVRRQMIDIQVGQNIKRGDAMSNTARSFSTVLTAGLSFVPGAGGVGSVVSLISEQVISAMEESERLAEERKKSDAKIEARGSMVDAQNLNTAQAVYALYRAGVFNGLESDSEGPFAWPKDKHGNDIPPEEILDPGEISEQADGLLGDIKESKLDNTVISKIRELWDS